jgi:hypothetical protein
MLAFLPLQPPQLGCVLPIELALPGVLTGALGSVYPVTGRSYAYPARAIRESKISTASLYLPHLDMQLLAYLTSPNGV